MGCKCKENIDKIGKYSDDKTSIFKPTTGLRKSVSVLVRTIISIFLFLIVIIALPFAFIYVGLMVAFGKEVKINLKKLFRLDDREQ